MPSGIVYSESFDLFQPDAIALQANVGSGWASTGNGNRVRASTTAPRTGPHSCYIDGSSAPGTSVSENTNYTFPATIASPTAQFALKQQTLPSSTNTNAGLTFWNGALTDYYGVCFNSSGQIIVTRAGVTIFTGAVFNLNVWYSVGLEMNAGGTWKLYVENALVGSGAQAGFGPLASMTLGLVGNVAGSVTTHGTVFIDDFAIYSGTYLFDMSVFDLLPNGDTAIADWTKASGVLGYAMIDNVPVNLAQYIQGNAAAEISDFNCASPPSTVFAVHDVCPIYKAGRTVAGVETMRSRLVQGVSVQVQTTQTPPFNSQNFFQQHYNSNPISVAPWAPADLTSGATQLGFERVA